MLPFPATHANLFWPAKLNATVKTSTGDLWAVIVYVNANESKLNFRVHFYIRSDRWLCVCVCG